MSQLTTIARPYAAAAFEFARDAKNLPDWSEQLALLAQVSSDQRVHELLDNPALTRAQRADVLLKICPDTLKPAVQNLVRLLADNNRLAALPDIQQQFEILKAEHDGSLEATVVSAQELPAEQQRKIAAALQKRLNKKIDLKCEIDAALIGGAIIKAGDLVIDGSIAKRVNKLTSALLR